MNKSFLCVALMLLLVSSTASAAFWDDWFNWLNPTGEAATAKKVVVTQIEVANSDENPVYAKAASTAPVVLDVGRVSVRCTGTSERELPIDVQVAVAGKEKFDITVRAFPSSGTFMAQADLGPFTAASAGAAATVTCTPSPVNPQQKDKFTKLSTRVQFRQGSPDFTIEKVEGPFGTDGTTLTEVRQGQAFKLKATVRNLSNAPYTGPLKVGVAFGEEASYTGSVDSVSWDADGRTVVEVSVPQPPVVTAASNKSFTATVDPSNQVAELKENNNAKNGTVRVSPLPPVGQPGQAGSGYDLEPYVVADKTQWKQGESVVFTFKVKNNGSAIDFGSFAGAIATASITGVPASAIGVPTAPASGVGRVQQKQCVAVNNGQSGSSLGIGGVVGSIVGAVATTNVVGGVAAAAVGGSSTGSAAELCKVRRKQGVALSYDLFGQFQGGVDAQGNPTLQPAEVDLFSVTVTPPANSTGNITASLRVQAGEGTAAPDANPANNEPSANNPANPLVVAYQAPAPVDCATSNTCTVTKALATDPVASASGLAQGIIRLVAVTSTVTATEGSGPVIAVSILTDGKGNVTGRQTNVVTLATGTPTPVTFTHTLVGGRGGAYLRVWSFDGKKKLADVKASFNVGNAPEVVLPVAAQGQQET